MARGIGLNGIIEASRFADLLIADPEITLEDKPEGMPTGPVKELLMKCECPVILAPFSFYGTDELIFAYDGSASSVFALKQFTYLFPGFTHKKITLLQVEEKEGEPVAASRDIGEWLKMHYASVSFLILKGKADNELFNYLVKKKNAFVVMGAFGRPSVSVFFRHSTADLVMKTINLPLFITHR